MSTRKLYQTTLDTWVNTLISEEKVIGVQAKNGHFVFEQLVRAEDLRLDYDVTILPPKKYFLPQRENLLEFDIQGKCRSLTDADSFILLGVHPYDVVAIAQMDKVFSGDNYDVHYMTRRHNATIIACDIQNPSANVFAGYLGTATVQDGFDILLTKIGDSYLAEGKTEKGDALLALIPGTNQSTSEDWAQREQLWSENKKLLRKHNLLCPPQDLPDLLENSYDNPVWEEKSSLCFSCGSCTLVCPTCYCFDVQDDVNWDLQIAKRTRTWDGCVLRDFAAVAGGHNFRQHRAERFRHRYYRKGKYMVDKLNELACVGCGRCITSCVPQIANPVDVYNHLYMSKKSIYLPETAILTGKEQFTENETFYEVRLDSGRDLRHKPGQFVEVSLPGIGEAPISISSSPTQRGIFQMVVRTVGNVSGALAKLNVGDKIGIRGPFGSTFPVYDAMKNKDALFVCGGIGLVPVRSAINYILANRKDYGHLTILFGVKTPGDRLFRTELEQWRETPGVTLLETVDIPDESWHGNVGVITTLLPQIKIDPFNTVAVICGPPVMYRFVLAGFHQMGMNDEDIFVSLERRMKCGVGKCGHCQMNDVYVCQEGPVFRYADIKDVMEAI